MQNNNKTKTMKHPTIHKAIMNLLINKNRPMRNPINNTPTIIFAALIPFIIGAAFLIFNDIPSSVKDTETEKVKWTYDIEEVVLTPDSLGILTAQLYDETRGERRAEVLTPMIMDIEKVLGKSEGPIPYLLADLLRDLSVEHPHQTVRLNAYITMVSALESEVEDVDVPRLAGSEYPS